MKSTKNVFLPITFWDKKAKQLDFINSGDFDHMGLLKKIGIAGHGLAQSFSTSNRDEILRRQEIIKMLYNSDPLRRFIATKLPMFVLPGNGQYFIDHFCSGEKHNPFWKDMIELSRLIDEARKSDPAISREIVVFQNFLKNSMDNAEATERKFGDLVSQELKKVSSMQGKVTLITKKNSSERSVKGFDVEKAEGYGYKKYSYYTKYSRIKKPEEWKDWVWYMLLIVLFPFGIFRYFYNLRKDTLRYSPLILNKVPSHLTDIIQKTINDSLEKNDDADNGVKFPFKPNYEDQIRLTLYFSYDAERGLSMRFVNLETISSVDVKIKNPFDIYSQNGPINDSFAGYSLRTRMKINRLNTSLMKSLANVVQFASFTRDLIAAMEELMPGIFQKGIELKSVATENEFKNQTIADIYRLPEIQQLFDEVSEYRSYIGTIYSELESISSLVSIFKDTVSKWNVPVSFPTILDSDKHLVTFTELIPIHLIDRKDTQNSKPYTLKDLIPINSLAPLNGKMLALTGQNAGGKTVTQETLISSVYLAQSGFPIFGTGMKLNPKKTIAMVFIERGQGSTAELLLAKIKNVLIAVKESNENGILVVMDELGTGTQEVSGVELGMKVLEVLNSKKCSVIFSSQITSLIEHARDTYGALPFKFNLAHEIQPGIGTGEIGLLISKLNMDELLEV